MDGINRYWFGEVNKSNANEIADVLRDFLGERPYISMSRRGVSEWGDVRPYQRMTEVSVFIYDSEPSSIHIFDTYGSHGVSCNKSGDEATFISFEGNTVKISQINGIGERLYWQFTHERERDAN